MNRFPGVLQCLVRARPISAGALGVLVWGVVVAPLVHSVGHRLDHAHGYGDEAARGDESESGEEHAHGHRHPHEHVLGYAHQPVDERGWDADADGAVDEDARHAHGEHQVDGREAGGGRSGHRGGHKPHGHGHNSLEHFGVALTSVPIFLPPKLHRLDLAIPAIEYASPSLSRRPLDSMRVRGPPIVLA